ncbi:amino acid/polyamine/organocation transporter (APC superfamily) [Luteococcus japonicus]|uniref:Amino acid/polyamine/organocation transporter (APC superfamily) n=1 Tax=Luteococcus japonicus TaxID=33984 RepID=A0A3N1ZTJ7_9ACTN|nr:APC family permease [Luteococcus japonicus]ROR54185.1 amino acid/polyamine/organocation transporter (APC superfamily) [Luteococcus japonicus]
MTAPATLARRLGLFDAVMIGLGSMLGAGVFVAFAPAARAAGDALLVSLAIAAVVAFCNATSSAQLAARYPTSGGTYFHGREELGPWPGFLAGWCFVIGKTASVAAMALTAAAYLVPDAWQRPAAVAIVWALAAANLRGITRTARITRLLAFTLLAVLALVVALGWTGGGASGPSHPTPTSALGILQGAGLLFFAFAGYARIATMGEEVVEPRRTIPRAIVLALGIALMVYLAVGTTLLHTLGARALGASTAPVASLVQAVDADRASPLVRLGAAAAAVGAVLNLMTGIGRTSLAMAREGDLPRALAVIEPVHQVPRRAELTLAGVVTVLVLLTDLRGAIGFSSFGVLLYYFVANAAAWHQSEDRRYPSFLQGLGMALCLLLVATLPWTSVVAGVAVLATGAVGRLIVRHGSCEARTE